MFGGHDLLVGGGASLRRDDVGIIAIYQEGVPVDPQLGAVASSVPGEQFDRSLRSVWIDKNKVELTLRMNTNADVDGDHHDDHEVDTITAAQVFARSVFEPRRLREWKRLVEERLWKSISFYHRRVATTDVVLINMPAEMLDRIISENTSDRDQEARPLRNRFQPISEEEEHSMWRGLMEPCRSHTQRLELRGELTAIQAQVLSSLYGKQAAAVSARGTTLSACRLRVLRLTQIRLTQQLAYILGEIIHGNIGPSCLKELSLSKCTIEHSAWSALLGRAPVNDSDSTDTGEYEVKKLDISQPNFHDNKVGTSIPDTEERKQRGKAASTMQTSPLSISQSIHRRCYLNALYLSDCNLRPADVEEILSSLRGHSLLNTLYMNGQQNFTAAQVDSLLITYLQENANVEHIQLPSTNHHCPQIQLYAELNRCGRRFLRARSNAGHGVGPPAPMGLWPLVLERVRRVPGLAPTRHANALYYFVKALHGVSTTGGTAGTRPP